MNRTVYVTACVLAASMACSKAGQDKQIVDDAAKALGGSQVLLDMKTLVIEGEGTNGNLGQDMTPEATGQAFELFGYRRSRDRQAALVRLQHKRRPKLPHFPV